MRPRTATPRGSSPIPATVQAMKREGTIPATVQAMKREDTWKQDNSKMHMKPIIPTDADEIALAHAKKVPTDADEIALAHAKKELANRPRHPKVELIKYKWTARQTNGKRMRYETRYILDLNVV